jgi:hypothetical protein
MIESYQVLSIKQHVNLNKRNHTTKKKSLIITWSAINRRYHIHMMCKIFVWHCIIIRDFEHGYWLAPQWLHLAKTGHNLRLYRQHLIYLWLMSCPLALECSLNLRSLSCPLSLECYLHLRSVSCPLNLECSLHLRSEHFLREDGVPLFCYCGCDGVWYERMDPRTGQIFGPTCRTLPAYSGLLLSTWAYTLACLQRTVLCVMLDDSAESIGISITILSCMLY